MFKKIKKYFQDVVSESKKVVWPTRQHLVSSSITVIGGMLVALLLVAAIDFGLVYLVKTFILGA